MDRRPDFAEPELLNLSKGDKEQLAQTIHDLYQSQGQERTAFSEQHDLYDQMFRGSLDTHRSGPWEGSANLHVQMPFWLVDSIGTRLTSAIWGQTPLVAGEAYEDDDEEIFRHSTALVSWHLRRMNARAQWTIVSRMRCIHGLGVGLILPAKDTFSFRRVTASSDPTIQLLPDGRPLITDDEIVVETVAQEHETIERTRYDGFTLHPVEWDDLIHPPEGMNLQPVSEANRGGTDYVGIRQWQPLSLMWKLKESAYGYIETDKDMNDRDWWLDAAPSQDRSDAHGGENTRARTQDRYEGRTRSLEGRRTPKQRANPEFETVMWFMPWEVDGPNGKVEEECLFYVSLRPLKLLGAFRLSDVYWQNRRPLLELHYQRGGTRLQSMGVMEIVKHLSAELDTIHNMRIDVGFATNMPFFFYQASSIFNPEKIKLRPLKGVPVDDVNAVRFPQLQNVTSFYHQEEQLLYTLIERVMGVTDLFLGISPQTGAAARQATGFVGTQQEALARTSEIVASDADAFSFLCHTLYNMEMQYGPEERVLRLQGREGPLTQQLTRDELWMRGQYDFKLGANEGMFSSMIRQQQGQALMPLLQNAIVAQDMGKQWEILNYYLHAAGFPNPAQFIGPKEAISVGVPKSQEEENGEMDQQVHGINQPAPVHPNDNDQQHMQKVMEHLNDPAYVSMGRPNQTGHMAHYAEHQAAIMQKQAMQQQQAQMAAQQQAQGPQGQQGQQGPALGQERIEPQLQGVGNMGAMGDVNQSPNGNGMAPPTIGQPL